MHINIPKVGAKRTVLDFFQWCPGTGRGVMAINLNTRPQDEEELLYIEAGRVLAQTAQGGCRVSLSETFKIHLEAFLCNLLQVTVLWQGGWTRKCPEVPLNSNNSVSLKKSTSCGAIHRDGCMIKKVWRPLSQIAHICKCKIANQCF